MLLEMFHMCNLCKVSIICICWTKFSALGDKRITIALGDTQWGVRSVIFVEIKDYCSYGWMTVLKIVKMMIFTTSNVVAVV